MNRVFSAAAALLLTIGVAHAQTAPASPAASQNAGAKADASGSANPAVATTDASADQPAKGANSFTKGQARNRIHRKGYSHVAGLSMGKDGVWRGTAEKDGQSVKVWLDYKGNVGEKL